MFKLFRVPSDSSPSFIAPHKFIGLLLESYSVTSKTSMEDCAGAIFLALPCSFVISEILMYLLVSIEGRIVSMTSTVILSPYGELPKMVN